MTALDVLARKIDELPGDVFRVFTSSATPATTSELAALELELGRPLPAELRALLLRWGVLIIEVVETTWPRPKQFDLIPAWQVGYGFHVLGCGAKLSTELTIAGALTGELAAIAAVPVLRRIGAPWLGVAVADGVGTWAPGDDEIERADGNVIDLILAEIAALEQGVATLTTKAASTDELLERARAAGWKGDDVFDVVDALKERPADEIGSHLREIVDALLDDDRHSMGILDVIAAAGPAYFAPVADRIYPHFATSDAQYVIQLLGKVDDASPRALALYREGLASDEDHVFEETASTLIALAAHPAVRALLPEIEALDNPEREPVVIGLLGHLGSAQFEARARTAIEADDDQFAALVQALRTLPQPTMVLAPGLLARLRSMNPDKHTMFNTLDVLCKLGIEDRAFMEPIIRTHFLARGPLWAERSEALLARWR